MQETSSLYKELLADPQHRVQTSLTIGESGSLIAEDGDILLFGDTSILIGSNGADSGYTDEQLINVETDCAVFADNVPAVGCCVASTIKAELLKPAGEIPRMARLGLFIRLTDGDRYSEWIPKGVFFTDTREITKNNELEKITLTGYDAMLKAEGIYPQSTIEWPANDVDVVREIAAAMDVTIDPRTFDVMNEGYIVQYPADYSMRETLGFIAGAYAGCFIMSDLGALRLITINGIPPESNNLITNAGDVILFGGDAILV